MTMRRTVLLAAAVVGLAGGVAGAADAKVSPEAQALIGQVASAYSGLTSLQVAGTFSADLDIAGQKRQENTPFSGSFKSPNRFRHELKDDVTVGSTGKKVYAYAKQPNVYFTSDAPPEADRPAPADLPDAVQRILVQQNPSVLLAVAKDPEAAIKQDATEITTTAPTTLGGTSYDTLLVSMGADKPSTKLLIDPKTHLIRQAQTDLKADVVRRGAPDVKKAVVTIDYTTVTPDAPVADTQLAWAAPAGAREQAQTSSDNDLQGAVKDLIGKAAPDFTLKQLGGGNVNLKDLKGSVVVLDFWATWCGPCVEGLPHVDAIYKDNKDKGLKAFAVNMQEEPDAVKAFIEQKKLSVPVLLETKGDVAEKYKVEGIPETVVIGKDGVVKKVFVGTGPDSEEQLRKAVESALAEK